MNSVGMHSKYIVFIRVDRFLGAFAELAREWEIAKVGRPEGERRALHCVQLPKLAMLWSIRRWFRMHGIKPYYCQVYASKIWKKPRRTKCLRREVNHPKRQQINREETSNHCRAEKRFDLLGKYQMQYCCDHVKQLQHCVRKRIHFCHFPVCRPPQMTGTVCGVNNNPLL